MQIVLNKCWSEDRNERPSFEEIFDDLSNNFDYMRYINFISSHFYSIDHNKLVKLPKSLLYSIISNKKLRITSEDSLLDFVTEIFKNDENDEQFNINQFYEAIEINGLSENKLFQFLNEIELSEKATIKLFPQLAT